jgi:hypothetical protein
MLKTRVNTTQLKVKMFKQDSKERKHDSKQGVDTTQTISVHTTQNEGNQDLTLSHNLVKERATELRTERATRLKIESEHDSKPRVKNC